MRIMDYNRVVRDLNGHSVDSFLKAVGERCTVTSSTGRVTLERSGTFGMYIDGRWYHLVIRPDRVPLQDPVRPVSYTHLDVYKRQG